MRDIEGTSLKIDKIIEKNNNKISKLWKEVSKIDSFTDDFVLLYTEANMLEDMNFKIEDFKKKWIESSEGITWHKVCDNL